MAAPLTIDVVSDVICPWCFIGTKNLEAAVASLGPETPVSIEFHPFLLDPSAPAEGDDLRDRLKKKFGNPEPMFKRVEEAARASGIPLDFSKIRRYSATLGAHTLIRVALAKGTQHALVDALFDAYFLQGRDVGAYDVLIDVGTRHGFTRDEVIALLEDGVARKETRDEASAAAAQGISGVPFFIFGQKVALSGAQPVATIRAAIDKALAGMSTEKD